MNTAEANKCFYDLVADGYEKADGRRKLQEWLEKIVYSLSRGHRTFLEIGAGTGYVTHIALKYFDEVIATDISSEMLGRILNAGKANLYRKVCSADNIAMDGNSVDVACAFATLHHLENLTAVFKEVYRVLKLGGIFYADHDIESHFVDNYRIPLTIYRTIKNKRGAFTRINKDAGKLYDAVEHRSNGIDADRVLITLTALGFRPYITYHWQGILPINGDFKKGQAPMMRILAVKK